MMRSVICLTGVPWGRGATQWPCAMAEVLIEQLKANYFLQKSKQNWVRSD